MQIANRRITEGDIRRLVVNYCKWLCDGVWLSNAVVTSSSTTSTVVGQSIQEGDKVVLFVSAGNVGDTFTLTVKVTTSQGATKTDTVRFVVVAP